MTTLSIQGVTVAFASVPALDGVTLTVGRGEWLSLIGPNGAGKTTLLRAIAAAMPLDAGAVWLDGGDVARLPARQRALHIAVVPQDHGLPAGWTVREVVAMGRAPHLGPWSRESAADREAVAGALRDTFTAPLMDRRVETLSGGERQRVLLARALAQSPRLLLLDEPTAFLDLQYQWEMLELVERARRERRLTVVGILHDLNLAAAFSDRFALLKGGRIMAMGTPAEVLTEAIIERGYGRRVTVGVHPATGRPSVLSWPSDVARAVPNRVHVVSGGGSGAAMIRRLVADGHSVTAGVLNVGDSDWETARALGVETADEAPFHAISPAARGRADALVRAADVVVVAAVPVGPGNLENLRVAAEAAARGQRVVFAGAVDDGRDFTGGAAAALYAEAVARGAETTADAVSALEHLNQPPSPPR